MSLIKSLFSLIFLVSLSIAQAQTCLPTQQSQFKTGTTITHQTLFGDPIAVQNGVDAIYNSSTFVNQHLLGFGALDPEPVNDQYDLSSLLERIGINNGIVKDAETIVLTACCAPEWMIGGPQPPNYDDPLPEHYDDYAELVAHVVQQPEFANIKYIQVWNELKGFYRPETNSWDSVGYTNLYNAVYDAVKAVKPLIKIGGPYAPMDSWYAGFDGSSVGGEWGTFDRRMLQVINYWLREKRGADFIVIDGHASNRDGSPPGIDQWAMTDKFTDFMLWLRNHPHPDAQTLPVWWGEWYVKTDSPTAGVLELNALMTVGFIKLIKSGVETALLWSAQGNEQGILDDGYVRQLTLFNSTYIAGGGQTTLFHTTQKYVKDHFSYPTDLIDVPSGNVNIDLIASAQKMLLVNKTNTVQNTLIGDDAIQLNSFQVLLIDTPSGLDGGQSSPTFNCNYIQNGDFETNSQVWVSENSSLNINSGRGQISNIQSVTNPWDAKIIYDGLCLPASDYEISLTARSAGNKFVQLKIGQGVDPYTAYFQDVISLGPVDSEFQFTFTLNQAVSGQLEIHVGSDTQDVFIDDLVIKETSCIPSDTCDLIANSSFEQGLTGWFSKNTDQVLTSGECVITANPVGINPWDATASYPDIDLIIGREYELRFKARSINQPRQVFVKVGMGQAPWSSYLWQGLSLDPVMNIYSFTFLMTEPSTTTALFEFHVGGDGTAIVIDDVILQTTDCGTTTNCPPMIELNGNIQSGTFKARDQIIADGVVLSNQNVNLHAGQQVILDVNFSVEQAAVFMADIQPCQ